MRVSEKDFDYMTECMERDLASMLVEERKLSIREALDIMYNSETYRALKRPESGLFYQSPLYVMSYLDDEIDTGSMAGSGRSTE